MAQLRSCLDPPRGCRRAQIRTVRSLTLISMRTTARAENGKRTSTDRADIAMNSRLTHRPFTAPRLTAHPQRPDGNGGLGDRLLARLERASRSLAASYAAEADAYALWSHTPPRRGH